MERMTDTQRASTCAKESKVQQANVAVQFGTDTSRGKRERVHWNGNKLAQFGRSSSS